MNSPNENDWFACASLDRVRRLDSVCRRFEDAWRGCVESPRLEDFLTDWTGAELEHLLRELMAAEVEIRQDRGQDVKAHEYLDRFPEHEAIVAEIFGAETIRADGNDTGEIPAVRADMAFGPYRIVREVGRGGMGIVYEAVHEALNRRVALKVLRSSPLRQAEQLRRFRREARTVARLQHPAIVPVFDTGEHNGLSYLVMHLVEGRNLDQVLKEHRSGRPLESAETRRDDLTTPGTEAYYRRVAQIGLAVAEALAHAHGQGVLHRDVKPSNLLLDADGKIWVTDFGLAKVETDGGSLTGTDQIVGTPRYLPPEAFEGRWDACGDLYSLGVTLYEMLTLRPAFPGATQHELLHQILNTTPPKPRQIDARIPPALEAIIWKAMQRQPDARYASAAELAEDLQRYVNGERTKPKRKPAAVLAALALVAVVSIVLLSMSWSTSPPPITPATTSIFPPIHEEYPGVVSAPPRLPGGLRWQMVRAAPTRIASIAWDYTGDLLAVGDHDGVIRILDWSVSPPRVARVLLGNRGSVDSLAWSRSGRLASAGGDGTVRVWDPQGLATAVFSGHQGPVSSLTWGPDERSIVSGGVDRTVRVWDLASGLDKVLHRDTDGHVAKLVVTPDGEHIVEATAQLVRVWNKAGILVQQFDHGHRVLSLDCSPAKNEIVTSGMDGRVKVWHIGRETPLESFVASIPFVAWNRTEPCLTLASEKAPAQLFRCRRDGSDKTKLADLGPDQVVCIACAPKADRIAIGCLEGSLLVWSKTGLQRLMPQSADSDIGYALAWHPDGRLLTNNPVPHVWQPRGDAARAVAPKLILHDVAWTGDGASIAGRKRDAKEIQFWSPDGKPGRSFPARSVQFSGDGKRYSVLNAATTELQVHDLDGQVGPVLSLGVRGFWISGIAWHPQAPRLAITKLGVAHVWDLGKPTSLQPLVDAGTDSIGAPAWSPDGKRLAISNVDRILLFDDAGKPDLRWTANHGRIACLAWSPDSQWLASCGEDRTVRLWTAQGQAGPNVTSPSMNLRRIAWGPNGRLAGINFAGEVFVWHYDQHTLKPAWLGFVIDDHPVAFAADGKVLLGDPALIEKHFLFVVEDERRLLETLRSSEFRRRHPLLMN